MKGYTVAEEDKKTSWDGGRRLEKDGRLTICWFRDAGSGNRSDFRANSGSTRTRDMHVAIQRPLVF